MDSHRWVALLAITLLISGCLATAGTLSFTATPATVCPETLSNSAYEETLDRWDNTSRTVEVAGQSKQIEVANHLAGYERTVQTADGDIEPRGGVVIFASPTAETAGQQLNPVREWSPRTMVTELTDRLDTFGDLENIEENDTVTGSIRDRQVTWTRFRATGKNESNDSIPVFVEVVRLEHNGDYLVFGRVFERDNVAETDRIDQVLGCLDHSMAQPPTREPTAYPTSVNMTDQQVSQFSASVYVESVRLEDGGYVVIYSQSNNQGAINGTIHGASTYLTRGDHQNVRVTLATRLNRSQNLIAVVHNDTDNDQTFDYVSSGEQDDGPYTRAGRPVADTAMVTMVTPTPTRTSYEEPPTTAFPTTKTTTLTPTPTPTQTRSLTTIRGTERSRTTGTGPGFGVGVTIVVIGCVIMLFSRRS